MGTKFRTRQRAIDAGFSEPTTLRDKLVKAGLISDPDVALTIAHRLLTDRDIKMVGIDTIDLACWLFNCTPGDLFEYKRTKPVVKSRR